MATENNNHHQESNDKLQMVNNQLEEQMQINYSPIMTPLNVSSIPEEFSIPQTKFENNAEEQNHLTGLIEEDTRYLEKHYNDEKKDFENLKNCQVTEKREKYLKEQFAFIKEYEGSLMSHYDGLKERIISYEIKLLSIKNQKAEIVHLSKEIAEIEKQNAKFDAIKSEKVGNLEKLRKHKETVEEAIIICKNRIENRRRIKEKFDVLQTDLEEAKQEKFEREKRIGELRNKIKSREEVSNLKMKEHEAVMQKLKLQNEKAELEIEKKKKIAKQIEEIRQLLNTWNEKEKFELNDRQKKQAEQQAELRKLEVNFKKIKEEFENNEKIREEFCKINNIEFISFKKLEIEKIQENLEYREQIVHNKKIELEKSEKELENLKKNHEEEIRIKKEKLEKAKNLLEPERIKSKKNKDILKELDQEIFEIRKKIEEQTQENETNLTKKNKMIFEKNELLNQIQELKIKIAEEDKNIMMVENMNKDVSEVNKDINETLKAEKILLTQVTQFKKDHKNKLALIEKQLIEKSRDQQKKIFEFEAEIEKSAKLLAHKKREVKRRDFQEMQYEQNLREKLTKLKQENEKFHRKSNEKIETVSSSTEDRNQQNLKSILKSPSKIIETKSPRKVKFEIESDDSSSILQMPLTQKPVNSP